MASVLWRLRRPARYEREYIAVSIERVPEDFLSMRLSRPLPRTIQEAHRSVEAAERCLFLLNMLGIATPLDGARDEDMALIFEALSEDPDLQWILNHAIPGFEEGIVNAEDWTAQLLRVAFVEIARRAEWDPTELLAYAIRKLTEALDERVEARAAMLAEQDRMSRERSLPDASALHALTRYETSLHRQFIQLTHELEAAQARRRGESTPLLRGDLHLIAET